MVNMGGEIMSIFKNEYLEITVQNNKTFIKTFKLGFQLKDFDSILRMFPRIRLTNFGTLKNILSTVSDNQQEFGVWLPSVELELSKDKMQASIILHESIDYIRDNKDKILTEINGLMAQYNIVHGIQPINLDHASPGKAILIAQGTPPKKGNDALLTYLQLPERKPVIREDGKADYFDMNFIFEIQEGMWLGEKIPPTAGIPGTTVDGALIIPQPGRDAQLKYDRQSAYEVEEDGKVVLRSRINGVLEHVQGLISVNRHLPINGDIGLETGNINFDGSVSVKGTVLSGYSIVAKGDISIEAPEGVSGAKLIKSVDGDVFIRGGIFGLGETVVEAGGNIFVKHVNEANLKATGDIIIGFYSMGSNLNASSIILDDRKGKIVGGKAIARKSITVAISGNRLERRTELIINSMNKQDVMLMIQERAATLKKVQEENIQIESTVTRYMGIESSLNQNQLVAYEQAKQIYNRNKSIMDSLDREIKQMMADLRNAGNEEIYVSKEAYPGTYIQIGKKSTILNNLTNGRFKIELGDLNV
jgi:uncharacterized protein